MDRTYINSILQKNKTNITQKLVSFVYVSDTNECDRFLSLLENFFVVFFDKRRAFLSINDRPKSLSLLDSDKVYVDSSGTLEGTTYSYNDLEFNWDEIIRVDYEHELNKDYDVGMRFYAWLPTGDVIVDESTSKETFIIKIIDRCILDVISKT